MWGLDYTGQGGGYLGVENEPDENVTKEKQNVVDFAKNRFGVSRLEKQISGGDVRHILR